MFCFSRYIAFRVLPSWPPVPLVSTLNPHFEPTDPEFRLLSNQTVLEKTSCALANSFKNSTYTISKTSWI